jgi:hypothetical protein
MKRILQFLVVLIVLASMSSGPTKAAVSVQLSIQEALYGGGSAGIARSDEPLTVGIPLPDDASNGVTGISSLGLTGASAGQFRVLGTWPDSGRAKWVLVDTQLSSLSAGATSTAITLNSSGSGNFGGSNLATDNGTTISVDTGTADFTIRKANFNGFHEVVVGATTVVSSGGTGGPTVVGPTAGNTTCGTCTTVYSSANDAGSTCTIEENGPVRACIKCTGEHEDGSGNAYMKFTVRMHFYKNKSYVKVTPTLRNADLGADDSDAIAYKGMAAYEWRLTANIAGTRNYQIAKDVGGIQSGTMSGSDTAFVYQGQSEFMEAANWDAVSPMYTNDLGWEIDVNGSDLDTGTVNEPVGGWADIRDSSGVGVQIGIYQMSAYWPKSLEFRSGGSDVRVGIWPSQNTRFYHQSWPQWSTHDLYFNFHDTALASPSNDFLKFQHYLIARAPYTHYNDTAVFPWPLVDPVVEQSWYEGLGSSAVPAISASAAWPYPDHNVSTNDLLAIHRFRAWAQGGGENQMELRWGYLMNWLQRGLTGRYLSAAHFYRFQTDDVFPHSDGFRWRDQAGVDVGFGRPQGAAWTSQNSSEAFTSWIDSQHQHWSGMMDYYFMTGDELVKEAILDGPLDMYTTPNTYGTDLALLSASRDVGARLKGYARLYDFLKAIDEDSEAATVIGYGEHIYEQMVKPTNALCAASDQTALGCTTPNPPSDGVHDGTSPLRGAHWAGGGYGEWCGTSAAGWGYPTAGLRATGPLQQGILLDGLLEFINTKGPSWSDYWEARDLAYGIARATIGEAYFENGSGRWDQEGFYAGILIDLRSGCVAPATEDDHLVEARTSIWSVWAAINLHHGSLSTYEDELNIAIQKTMAALSVNWGENGSFAVTNLIDMVENPGTVTLQDVTITSFVDNGGGSYTIGWTVPVGAQSYRIKWHEKTIVDWLNFQTDTAYDFGIDPLTNHPWFSANNVTPPVPGSGGAGQTTTISTGETGLNSSNFSVKAYVDSDTVAVTPPIVARFRRIAAPIVAGDPDVAWSTVTYTGEIPNHLAQRKIDYDSVSSRWFTYSGLDGVTSGIYSTNFVFCNSSTLVCTEAGGTSSPLSSSAPDYPNSTPGLWNNGDGWTPSGPGPSDRHPDFQMAIDTFRNKIVQVSGLLIGHSPNDYWEYSQNADPTSNTMAQISTTGLTGDGFYINGSLVYVPDYDVFWVRFGNGTVMVLCRTASISGNQSSAGCVSQNAWATLSPSGTAPSFGPFSNAIWDPITSKILVFSFDNGGGTAADTTVYSYDVLTKTWAHLNPSNKPTNVAGGSGFESLATRITSGAWSGKFLYVRTGHSYSATPAQAAVFLYNSELNTWTQLTVTGTGPSRISFVVFDPNIGSNGGIVAHEGLGGQSGQFLHGVLH